MLTFISCAKTMTAKTKVVTTIPTTIPIFNREAERHALELSSLSVEELGRILHINPKLAAENVLRYQDFFLRQTGPYLLFFRIQVWYSSELMLPIFLMRTLSMPSDTYSSLRSSTDYYVRWIILKIID